MLIRLVLAILVVSASAAAQNPCIPRKPPLPPEQARENLKKAAAAYEEARKKANDATRDLLHYQHRYPPARGKPGDYLYKPPHPKWDKDFEKQLADKMEQLWNERTSRYVEWGEAQRAARDAQAAARGAQGHLGPSPLNRPPAPKAGGSGGGSGSTKTEPDLGDTIPGHPPGPIYAPVRGGPQFPAGSRVPPSKMAAGTAGVTDSFWPFPWK